jgi:hypothetical protein
VHHWEGFKHQAHKPCSQAMKQLPNLLFLSPHKEISQRIDAPKKGLIRVANNSQKLTKLFRVQASFFCPLLHGLLLKKAKQKTRSEVVRENPDLILLISPHVLALALHLASDSDFIL